MADLNITLPNKKQAKVTAKALDAISRAKQFGIPIEMIALSNVKEASDNTQNILGEVDNMSEVNDLSQIWKNQIPNGYGFEFWQKINYWADSKIAKFISLIKCDDLELLQVVIKLIKNACLFNEVGFKSLDEYGVIATKKCDKWSGKITDCFISPCPYSQDAISGIGGKGELVRSDIKANDVKLIKDFAFLQWRDIGIGDYVIMLKPLLLEIYKKNVIDLNASNLTNVPLVKVGSIENFRTELAFNTNPLNRCRVQIIDKQSTQEGMNIWDTEGDKTNDQHLDELHTDLRFHKEWYCGWNEVEQMTAKGQTLTADSNLGNQQALSIQYLRFLRIKAFIEKISELTGVAMSMEEYVIDEEQQEPENENADKENPSTDTAISSTERKEE